MSSFSELLDGIPLETVDEVVNICERFNEDVTTRFGDITCAYPGDDEDEIDHDFFYDDITDIIGKELIVKEITPTKPTDVANSASAYNLMRMRLARKAFGRQNSWHGPTASPGGKRRKRHSSCNEVELVQNKTSNKTGNISNGNLSSSASTGTNGRESSSSQSSKLRLPLVYDSISNDSGCSMGSKTASYPNKALPRSDSLDSYGSVFSDPPFSTPPYSPDVNGTPSFCTVYKLTYTHTEQSLRYASPHTFQYGLVAMVTDATSYYRADVVTCYFVQGSELELKDSYGNSQSEAQRGESLRRGYLFIFFLSYNLEA